VYHAVVCCFDMWWMQWQTKLFSAVTSLVPNLDAVRSDGSGQPTVASAGVAAPAGTEPAALPASPKARPASAASATPSHSHGSAGVASIAGASSPAPAPTTPAAGSEWAWGDDEGAEGSGLGHSDDANPSETTRKRELLLAEAQRRAARAEKGEAVHVLGVVLGTGAQFAIRVLPPQLARTPSTPPPLLPPPLPPPYHSHFNSLMTMRAPHLVGSTLHVNLTMCQHSTVLSCLQRTWHCGTSWH
jgi:hypothetical protein